MGESAKRYPAPIGDLPKKEVSCESPEVVGVPDDASQRRRRKPGIEGGGGLLTSFKEDFNGFWALICEGRLREGRVLLACMAP
jgi:hypothetical protein